MWIYSLLQGKIFLLNNKNLIHRENTASNMLYSSIFPFHGK